MMCINVYPANLAIGIPSDARRHATATRENHINTQYIHKKKPTTMAKLLLLLAILHVATSFNPSTFLTPRGSATATSSSSLKASDYDIVTVDLDDRSYPIYIGGKFDDDEGSKLLTQHVKGNRVFLITNDLIAPLHLERYEKMLSQEKQVGTLLACLLSFWMMCICSTAAKKIERKKEC